MNNLSKKKRLIIFSLITTIILATIGTSLTRLNCDVKADSPSNYNSEYA